MKAFTANSKFVLGAVLVLITCCVSRSVPDARFSASSNAHVIPSIEVSNPDYFSFAAVGDLHVINQGTALLKSILAQAIAEKDEFIVFLGDFVDKGDREDMLAIRERLSEVGWQDKALFILGNHDIFGDGWKNSLEINGPSHYAIVVGNSKLVAIDTADGSVGYQQFEWFQNELKGERPTHLFVLSHYMPIIPGQRTLLKIASEEEASMLMKLSSTHKVTAWMGGHYHSYIAETADGVQYVVAGGGGGRRMPPVWENFFVQVVVAGNQVTFHLRKLP